MMDFFGTGNYAKTSDLESLKTVLRNELVGIKNEIVGIKNDIDILRNDIDLKVTDSEETAKNSAASAVEAEERVIELELQFKSELEGLQQISIVAKAEVDKITAECERIVNSNKELHSSIEKTTELFDGMLEVKSEVDSAKSNIHSNIEVINDALKKSEVLPEAVEKVEELLNSASDLSSKIGDLLSHSASKKGEIDDLRDKILGKEIVVDGANVHVDGIKDKLEKSYMEIDSKIENLDGGIQDIIDSIKSSHDQQLSKHTENFETLVSNSKNRIVEIDTQLKDLLPGAMAAGLSAAYAKKKDDETESLVKSEEKFQTAIRNMIFISAIPFAVDVYLLFWEKIGIIKVIQDTPNLLIAILPLYLPAVWIAISLNKKINLSKRLIEEYTHKEVLGKTFSGISTQIETLKADVSIKEELRTQLLFNLLHVSAENPGKLITDYNKSDHPLLSVLENSKKLTDSMEALSKIPGLGRISKILAERAEKKVEENAMDVAKGLDLNDLLEGENSPEQEPEPAKS
ncbi:hypothetical protein [Janthinobacterium sp. JC611]|uniref:hypothetical protein n=1 Tax=Janthinobacterium sp. JC611 TaxID=2816201 RepID=UPI001BFE2700|nr:hypothetical protein [Janthinobacterium sp. JC611]